MSSPQPQVSDEAVEVLAERYAKRNGWTGGLKEAAEYEDEWTPGTLAEVFREEARQDITDLAPLLHADWEREVRGRLQAEIDRIDQELAELEPVHNPPSRGIGFSKEAAYAVGLEVRRTCFEQARDAALTNREETPNA